LGKGFVANNLAQSCLQLVLKAGNHTELDHASIFLDGRLDLERQDSITGTSGRLQGLHNEFDAQKETSLAGASNAESSLLLSHHKVVGDHGGLWRKGGVLSGGGGCRKHVERFRFDFLLVWFGILCVLLGI